MKSDNVKNKGTYYIIVVKESESSNKIKNLIKNYI